MRKIVSLVLTVVLLLIAIVFNVLKDGKSNVEQHKPKDDHTIIRQITEIELADNDSDHEAEHTDGDNADENVDTE